MKQVPDLLPASFAFRNITENSVSPQILFINNRDHSSDKFPFEDLETSMGLDVGQINILQDSRTRFQSFFHRYPA